MKNRVIYPGIALVLLLAAPLPATGEKAGPELLALIQEAGGPEAYPDADIVYIDEKIDVAFEEKGDSTARRYKLAKILTEKGKKDLALAKFGYHKRYMEVRILRARVINADGSVVDVGEDAITDGTMTETQAMNILEENFRIKSITFPDLDVGDSVETEVEIISRPVIKDNYNTLEIFQYDQPLVRKTLVINGPSTRPLYHVAKNGALQFTGEEKEGRTFYTWSAEQVPMIVPEPGMVSFQDVALKLIVSTFKDWQSLSAYGNDLNRGKIDITENMKQKVVELTADKDTPEDKIQAINYFISTNVRYMGSSMDVGAFLEPHEASYTFEKQYGVCRDKSILMMSLLSEIGIESFDTLVNVSSSTEPEIPSIYFEHAVCGVKLPDGKTVYVDPTMELSTAFGEPYMGDLYVLHLDEPGQDLIKLPPIPAEASMGLIEIKSELRPDGLIQGNVSISGKGFYDYVLRTVGQQIKGFQFAMLWQQLGATFLSNNIKVLNPTATDPSDLDEPYRITFSYELPEYVVRADQFSMFRIPSASHAFDLPQIGVIKKLSGLAEREYPLFLFSSRGTTQRESIKLPAGYKVKAFPDPVEIIEGPISLKIETLLEGNTIHFTSDFRIEKSRLSPEEYMMLKKVLKKLDYFQKSMIILEKSAS